MSNIFTTTSPHLNSPSRNDAGLIPNALHNVEETASSTTRLSSSIPGSNTMIGVDASASTPTPQFRFGG